MISVSVGDSLPAEQFLVLSRQVRDAAIGWVHTDQGKVGATLPVANQKASINSLLIKIYLGGDVGHLRRDVV